MRSVSLRHSFLRKPYCSLLGSQFMFGLRRLYALALSGGPFMTLGIDAANRPGEPGGDFQLVPNPNARTPLPSEFRLKGTYFRTEHAKDSFNVIPERPS